MKVNKGISLIVLVITIIVMIVLAGSIILSLSNNGIIGKANETVDLTNEVAVKQLADLKWSEAYLDGSRTKADLEEKVLNGLFESGIDMNAYAIKVTENGVIVEKIESEYSYYSTLELAIDDVNTSAIGRHADSNKKDAEAVVYTHNNTVYVALLKNSSVNENIYIYKDMELKLNGYELASNMSENGTFIYIGSDGTNIIAASVNINGSIDESKITTPDARITKLNLVAVYEGSVLNVSGGKYILSLTGGTEMSRAFASKGEVNITNATIITNGTTGEVRGIDILGTHGKGTITNCEISAESVSTKSVAVRSNGKEINIYKCEMNSSGRGVSLSQISRLDNCEINGNDMSIFNDGTSTFNNCIVNGMIENQGDININGGTYQGKLVLWGENGTISYINGANISSLEINYNDNMVYMNDCKITSRALKIRGDE